jgi:hypothetical protein
MKSSFDRDPYPGAPRILFVGHAESSHARSWIDLLADEPFNVRMFALPPGHPPDDWGVRTYVSPHGRGSKNRDRRKYDFPWLPRVYRMSLSNRLFGSPTELDCRRLASIISCWKPDIIHTFGLDPAGYFCYDVRRRFGLAKIGRWVLQFRGGSDLQLRRHDAEFRVKIRAVIGECDQLVSDNLVNYEYLREIGVSEWLLAERETFPGTGGIAVGPISRHLSDRPSMRRAILLPKAYDSPWSLAMPVFEALHLCGPQLLPCEIYMLAMTRESRMWFHALPKELKDASTVLDRVPRNKVLELMLTARVMLSPSLVDGVPNVLYEAMACGAFPIVSPLETIVRLVEAERHVLFARNLYPEEIAAALTRAMTDDDLVNNAAQRNLELVSAVADRSIIRPRVVELYRQLARQRA